MVTHRRSIFKRDEGKQDSLSGQLSLSGITHSKIRSLLINVAIWTPDIRSEYEKFY